MQKSLSHEIEHCHATLLAVVSVLPQRSNLEQESRDAEAAEERGYYLPDEDDRLREVFAQYLEVRATLRDVVHRMEPWVDQGSDLARKDRLCVFTIGFTAACFLVRNGHYLIEMAKKSRIVRKKLDEAEPRFGIPRKSFTEIYRQQSSVRRMWKFYEAWTFYDENKEEILELKENPEFKDLVTQLEAQEPFMETSRRSYLKHRIHYRYHSFRRRNRSTFDQSMFRLFEIGGRTVAELRDPTVGLKRLPKRTKGAPLEAARALLEPGDIIITRHRDALSNLFLPGFWPHGALFVGDYGKGEGEVMESKKDGVLLRSLDETLAVDAFVVFRAKLDSSVRGVAAERALTHQGKLYDFAFDFRQSHTLVCTALIYQSWHGQEGVSFKLGRKSGRTCLPAEALMQQALEGGMFEVVGYFGPECESVSQGEDASEKFMKQFDPQ